MNSFLQALRSRQDLLLIIILMLTIMMMILPMPTLLVDFLIAINISFTVLMLMVSIYIRRPEEFSTFPSIILLGTAFRLSISISTSRLILADGDAGHIVATFGEFVTSGNLVIGLVVFLIITTVQFMVITKGAERVAEVAARFNLDAMPGRQMSIDAEMRAGDITQAEATARRKMLDKQNQFYGAMDGSMKFVKGDAIAGIIIVVINLIGGITVGVLQQGRTINEAMELFTLLTVGDGLVAQIPALFMALCAGTVVTRVNADDNKDLGTDIFKQLAGSSRSLFIASGIIGFVGLVPGFPLLAFWSIAAAVGFGGLALHRREQEAANRPRDENGTLLPETVVNEEEAAGPFPGVAAQANDLLVVRIGAGLTAMVQPAVFAQKRAAILDDYEREIGARIAEYGLAEDAALPPQGFGVLLDGVPLFQSQIEPGTVFVRGDPDVARLSGASPSEASANWPMRGFWVPQAQAQRLNPAQFDVLSLSDILAEVTGALIRRAGGQMIGYRQVEMIVGSLSKTQPQLADQIKQVMPVPRLLDVLRRLVDEGVPLLPRRLLFETLVEWAPKEADTSMLSEHVRRAMRRQLSYAFADESQMITCHVIEPQLEQTLRESIRRTEAGAFLALQPVLANALLQQIEGIKPPADPNAKPPAIVTTMDLRRLLRGFLQQHRIDIPVLALSEISPEFKLMPIGTISSGMNIRPVQKPAA
jgi:type III secretion protein V